MSSQFISVGSVDSTNSEALRRIEGGLQPPFLLVAEEQAVGRGRGGKTWSSPKGNFYGTFTIVTDQPDATIAQVSFVAAVALASILSELGLKPQLKWPNDVLIGGAKVSGILLEKHGGVLLIGMGVNLIHHPDLSTYASTSLRDLGYELSPFDMASRLSHAFDMHYGIWMEKGFEPIRQSWLSLAYGLNQGIEVRLAGQDAQPGTFRGLDGAGALQLQTPDGLRSIHAGEVYFHDSRN